MISVEEFRACCTNHCAEEIVEKYFFEDKTAHVTQDDITYTSSKRH